MLYKTTYMYYYHHVFVNGMQFVPESARFYVVKGENKKAEKVLRRVAFYNFKEPLLVSLLYHTL